MRNKLFILIASMLISGATFADTKTVTTQDYVDTNFQSKIPAGSFGANNSVVTYDSTTGNVQERLIIHPTGPLNEISIKNQVGNGTLFSDSWVARLKNFYGTSSDDDITNAILPGKYIVDAFEKKQHRITPGTTGSVAIFNGTLGGNGSASFTERAIYDGSTTYDSTTDTDKLVTAGVVDNKQDKMTCARWLGDEHTDENCLLWNVAN